MKKILLILMVLAVPFIIVSCDDDDIILLPKDFFIAFEGSSASISKNSQDTLKIPVYVAAERGSEVTVNIGINSGYNVNFTFTHTNDEGEIVPIEISNVQILIGFFANENGNPFVNDIPIGTHQYRVVADGYVTQTGQVQIIDRNIEVEIEMEEGQSHDDGSPLAGTNHAIRDVDFNFTRGPVLTYSIGAGHDTLRVKPLPGGSPGNLILELFLESNSANYNMGFFYGEEADSTSHNRFVITFL